MGPQEVTSSIVTMILSRSSRSRCYTIRLAPRAENTDKVSEAVVILSERLYIIPEDFGAGSSAKDQGLAKAVYSMFGVSDLIIRCLI